MAIEDYFRRALVVDDDLSNILTINAVLDYLGVDTTHVESGYEALEKLIEHDQYDVVFMDLMMPKLNGIDTIKAIRERGSSIPIVPVTAHPELCTELKKTGLAYDCLAKPIDFRRLEACLEKILEQTP